MNLLSIDPGTTCCGWAYWRNRELSACGLSRTKATTVEARIRDHDFRLHWGTSIDVLVIEKPEVYQQRFWKGDPRDLIDLAMVVGGIVAQFPDVRSVKTVFPKDWKGQLPKDVSERRTLSKLSETEKQIVKDPHVLGSPTTAPQGLLNNMFDALGIGLWALQR